VAFGFYVVVEKDLLAGKNGGSCRGGGCLSIWRSNRWRSPVIDTGDRRTAVDGVLLSFFRAVEIPPLPAANRHAQIGFLSAGFDLFKHLLLQHTQVACAGRGVCVLGMKVREGVRALFVAHPLVVVDVVVAVVDAFGGNLRGFRWREHDFSVGRNRSVLLRN